jgi:hypothetical protein
MADVENSLTDYADQLKMSSVIMINAYSKIKILITHTQGRLIHIADSGLRKRRIRNHDLEEVLEEYNFNLKACLKTISSTISLLESNIDRGMDVLNKVELLLSKLGVRERAALQGWQKEFETHQEYMRWNWLFCWIPFGETWTIPPFDKEKPDLLSPLKILKQLLLDSLNALTTAWDYFKDKQCKFVELRKTMTMSEFRGQFDMSVHLKQVAHIVQSHQALEWNGGDAEIQVRATEASKNEKQRRFLQN